MKTNILSLLAIAGLLTFASCANDDTASKDNDQEPGTEGLTSFVEEDQATRTTGEYDGSGLNFFWTAGDRLWVNTGTTTSPVLTQDSQNNINSTLVNNPTNPSAVKRVDKAKFYFAGTFTASSYPVRYTGKNGAKDKVTIKAAQSQTVPNDASHIGEDGDFGVATATKPVGSGKYHFTLDHKASYITFMPYTTQSVVTGVKIQKIRVSTGNTSDALAGTFDLADDGTLSNAASTSNSVELTVPNFSIPTASAYATNGATMVVNPGTYNSVSIEHTIHDPVSNLTGTSTKTYPSVIFTAGKNKRVSTNLQLPDYSPWLDDNYMWDAQKPYWYGKTLPAVLQNNVNYSSYGAPIVSDANRWYNTANSTPRNASNSCTIAPNANELWYYARYGNPCWDSQKIWIFRGRIYNGGIWLKKQKVIYNELKTAGYNQLTAQSDMKERYYSSSTDATGSDFRTIFNATDVVPSSTPPANIANYFYLPALGGFGQGNFWLCGVRCLYWSSTGLPNNSDEAYYLNILSNRMYVDRRVSYSGFYVRPFE